MIFPSHCTATKPDDLLPLLYKDICYQGDILEYKEDSGYDYEYFSPWTFHLFWDSVITLMWLFMRTFVRRQRKRNEMMKEVTR